MNKKFFTLMAGVFLLAGLVGNGYAQDMGNSTLVTSFPNDAAKKLYQLTVFRGSAKPTGFSNTNDSLLIMKSDGTLELSPYKNYFTPYTPAGKTEEVTRKIGESLWCAEKTDEPFTGGLGVNFRFTSKSAQKFFMLAEDMGKNVNVNYGNLTDWGFSGSINSLGFSPLYSYLDKDNVLTLLSHPGTSGVDTLYVAKINYNKLMELVYGGGANVNDADFKLIGKDSLVYASGSIPTHKNNLLWFSLSKPAALTLNANDFNTKLDTEKARFKNITFSLDNAGVSPINPWSKYALKAKDVKDLDKSTFPTTSTIFNDSAWVAFYLETELTSGKKDQWLRVDTAYSTNGAATQYLTFNFGADPFGKSGIDSTMAGQYLFKLQYNISDDELFIDAMQVTHNRTSSLAATASGKLWWREILADPAKDLSATPAPDGVVKTGYVKYDGTEANLLGKSSTDYTTSGSNKWNYLLRVALVDIDGDAGTKLVTLNNIGFARTVGRLGITSCTATGDDFESVLPGLYTIQLKDSKNVPYAALSVPINTDSLDKGGLYPVAYTRLDGINNPIYTPSAQWIVKQTRPSSSSTSSLTIINREFPNIVFNSVQLKKNKESVDAYDAIDFRKAYFDLVPATQAKDTFLGYFYVSERTAKANKYSFQYYHDFDQSHFLGVESGTNRIRIAPAQFQFELEPIKTDAGVVGVEYGYKPNSEEAKSFVQLKRVAYKLKVQGGNVLQVNAQDNVYRSVKQGDVKPNENGLSDEGVFLIKSYHFVKGQTSAEDKLYYALLDTNSFYGRYPDYASKTAPVYNKAGQADYGTTTAGQPASYEANALKLSYTKLSIADGSIVAYANIQSEARTSAFFIGVYTTPIYRRFDGGTYTYQNANETIVEKYKGDSADVNSPLWLKFYDMNLKDMYLYENSEETNAFHKGIKNISFLGIQDVVHYKEGDSAFNAPKYQFYVDTAFVKRTADGKAGPSVKPADYTPMPQYMLAVRPIILPEGKIWVRDGSQTWEGPNPPSDPNGPMGEWTPYDVKRLTRGMYLFNAQDSIYRNKNYEGRVEDNITGDVRLAFVDGVHYGDTFYVIPPDQKYKYDSSTTINFQRNPELLKALPWYCIHDLSQNTHYEPRWYAEPGKYDAPKEPNARYDDETKAYASGNNITSKTALNGKSMVFQFRLRNLGQDGGNPNREFFIESQRPRTDYEIEPDVARFVNNHQGVPVISSDVKFQGNEKLNDAALGFNVTNVEKDDPEYGKSTANETVVIDGAKIISGVNSVTILNAAGKTVTVTNVLGQAVAKTVVSSDNASISLPKGIVIVSVDGKSAKALVK
jgi:hypothetical protein